MAKFYPTTVMETGYDIIFFWVARMIMMGLRFTGEVPFETVYLHGLVRAEDGRKMSKSLGNVLDPLDLIRDYGLDAMRFSLLTGGTPGNDMKLSVTRIESNRNFANKIWNAARFVIMNLEDATLPIEGERFQAHYALPERDSMSLTDRWILSRLATLEGEVARLVAGWQLGEAGRQLYDFLWNEYCDWYIEASKPRLYDGDEQESQATRQVLAYVLERSLRLLHPFMPFVTEAIWQNLPGIGDAAEALIIARYPTAQNRAAEAGVDEESEDAFGRVQETVRAIRNARAEYEVEPSRRITALISADGYTDTLRDSLPVLASLARLDTEQTTVGESLDAPDKAVTLTAGGITTYLPLAGLVDLDAERARLEKEMANVEKQLQRVNGMLANEKFTSKAPDEVVERERSRRAELVGQQGQLKERLAELG